MEVISLDVVCPWIYGSMATGNILDPTQSSAIRNQTDLSTNYGSLILMLFFFLFLYFSLFCSPSSLFICICIPDDVITYIYLWLVPSGIISGR